MHRLVAWMVRHAHWRVFFPVLWIVGWFIPQPPGDNDASAGFDDYFGPRLHLPRRIYRACLCTRWIDGIRPTALTSTIITAFTGVKGYVEPPRNIRVPVQVNGKLVFVAQLSPDWKESDAKSIVYNDPRVKERIAGNRIVRIVVVPGKLINVIVD